MGFRLAKLFGGIIYKFVVNNPTIMNNLLFQGGPILWVISLFLALFIISIFYLLFFARPHKGQKHDKLDELYFKIRDEIRSSVSPHFVQITPEAENIIELAIETWRMEQRLGKVSSVLPENQKRGMESSLAKFKRFLEKYDIEVIDYTGQKYNEGLNIEILSVEKDPLATERSIKETVEPSIISKGRVIKRAKVVLVSSEI